MNTANKMSALGVVSDSNANTWASLRSDWGV